MGLRGVFSSRRPTTCASIRMMAEIFEFWLKLCFLVAATELMAATYGSRSQHEWTWPLRHTKVEVFRALDSAQFTGGGRWDYGAFNVISFTVSLDGFPFDEIDMKTYVASAGWTSKPIQDWVFSLFQVPSRRVSLFGWATKLMFTADGGCALPCGHSYAFWLS